MNRFVVSFLFFFAFSAVAQSAPAGVAFTSEAQTVAAGAISEIITIQAQDGSGNAFKLPTTGCVSLSSSASGEFSSSASSWSAVSVLTMNKNSANRNFYYKGTAAGTHTLTARLVLKPESESRSCANWPIAEWPAGWAATQQITVSSGTTASSSSGESASTSSSTPTTSEQTSLAPSASNTGAPSEPAPSLVVKVSGPATVSVGADATFSATVFGVKKEPIPNARVVWSFGNGAVKEGLSVRYGYNIPGSYLVVVDASSGGLAGSARLAVHARMPDVHLSRVEAGVGGFVEIENRSNAELDVSGWGIASSGTLFTIPDRTIILPSAKVAFPSEITKLSLVGNDAQLLFPNGTLAVEYVEAPKKPEPVIIPKLITPTFSKNPPPPASSAGRQSPTTTPAAIALSVTDTSSNSGVGMWLWGVLGACVVGVGALAAFRLKPPPPEESEEKEFAEKVHIV